MNRKNKIKECSLLGACNVNMDTLLDWSMNFYCVTGDANMAPHARVWDPKTFLELLQVPGVRNIPGGANTAAHPFGLGYEVFFARRWNKRRFEHQFTKWSWYRILRNFMIDEFGSQLNKKPAISTTNNTRTDVVLQALPFQLFDLIFSLKFLINEWI